MAIIITAINSFVDILNSSHDVCSYSLADVCMILMLRIPVCAPTEICLGTGPVAVCRLSLKQGVQQMINGFLRSQNPSRHCYNPQTGAGVNRSSEADPSGALFSGVQMLVRRPALRMPH